jgi:hypothetical protein
MVDRQNIATIVNRAVIAQHHEPEWHQPFHPEVIPSAPYPVDCLGVLRPFVEANRYKSQAPLAMCAQSALASVSLAILPHCNVDMPDVGPQSVGEFFLTLGGTGERKDNVDGRATLPISSWERLQEAEYAQAVFDIKSKHEMWQFRRDQIRRALKKDGNEAAAKKKLADNGPEPVVPKRPVILASADTTQQGIVKHLTDHKYIGIFSSEVGALLGGHAWKEDNRLQASSLLNDLWDAKSIKVLRGGADTIVLHGRRGAMHLLCHPPIFTKLLNDDLLLSNGFLSRFLVVTPPSTAGARKSRRGEEPEWVEREIDIYHRILDGLVSRTPNIGDDGGLEPPLMSLDKGAIEACYELNDHIEDFIAANPHMVGEGSRTVNHTCRLAAIMASIECEMDGSDYANRCITEATLRDAASLAVYYLLEMTRMRDHALISPRMRKAELVWNVMQTLGRDQFYLADVYRGRTTGIYDAETAKSVVDTLVAYGYCKTLPPGTVIDGAPRVHCWQLI